MDEREHGGISGHVPEELTGFVFHWHLIEGFRRFAGCGGTDGSEGVAFLSAGHSHQVAYAHIFKAFITVDFGIFRKELHNPVVERHQSVVDREAYRHRDERFGDGIERVRSRCVERFPMSFGDDFAVPYEHVAVNHTVLLFQTVDES